MASQRPKAAAAAQPLLLLVLVLALARSPLPADGQRDPYRVLGLRRDASEQEVKRAFRKLSLKVHPDKVRASGGREGGVLPHT